MRKNLSKWLASIFAIALSVTMTATPIAQAAIVESSQGESKTAVKTPIEEGDFSEDALIFDSTEEGQNIEIASEESAEEENAKVESEISVEEESIEIDSGELGEADETNSGELGEAEENPSESEDTQTYEMAEEETIQATTVKKVAEGTCGKNLKWYLDSTGVLTISGTGAMYKYDDIENSAPWFQGTDDIDIVEIKVEKGVTNIEAFGYCPNLETVILPNTLISIGAYAFDGDRSLVNITIPIGVKKIGESAFSRCISLTKINLPDTMTSIGESAFYQCNGLKSIIIPKNVTSIEDCTFFGCWNLTSIQILNSSCKINDTEDTISETATIYGYENSTAQAYAKKYKRTFKALAGQTNTYMISYNANGGKNAPAAQAKKKGVTLTLSKTKPTRKGYTFVGWATSKSSTKVSYKSGASFKSDKNTTLYAVWQANAYKVAFNKNGGTGSMSTLSCVYDKTFTLKANAFKRKGYTFKGWNTKADGTGTYSYADKEKVKNVSSVAGKTLTLYAQWEPNAYKVAFDKNGGTGSMSTVSCVYDKTFTLKANTFKKKGYTFKGWNTKADGTGTYSYADKAKVKNVSSVAGKTMKLFAQWEPNKYILRYDGNGATSGRMEDTKDCQYDKSYTLRENAFERKGYTFVGWAKSAKGALRYKNTEKVTNISSVDGKVVVLYAVWEKNE